MTKRTNPRRRKYAADPVAMYKVFNRLAPFNQAELMQLELPIRISFEALKTGRGTERDWSDIAAAVNICIVRSHDISPDCVAVAEAASDALMRTWNRAKAHGAWGFDGPAIAEVAACIDLHEQFCELSTPLQLMNAMRKVVKARAAQGVTA